MSKLKLKIKKTKMYQRINGVKTLGYYGRVHANGKMKLDELCEYSTIGSTFDPVEVESSGKMLLKGIRKALMNGYICDLGVLGTFYPSAESNWHQDPDDCTLAEQKLRVRWRPSDEIDAAIAGASIAWTSEDDDENNTVDENQGGNTGGNGGGNSEEIG